MYLGYIRVSFLKGLLKNLESKDLVIGSYDDGNSSVLGLLCLRFFI